MESPFMKPHIIVCGLNGCGKSTFGKALAKKLNAVFKDIEDYCFPNRQVDDVYTVPRSKEDVSEELLKDFLVWDMIVLAAVKADYSKEIEKVFSKAIYIEVPKDIRLMRVRERSFEKFGNRMLKGGDLYETEESFFHMVEKRPDSFVEEWLSRLSIPVIKIDGTRPIDENVDYVVSLTELPDQRHADFLRDNL